MSESPHASTEAIIDLVNDYSDGKMDRREFFRRSAGLGISASAAAALLGGAAPSLARAAFETGGATTANLRLRIGPYDLYNPDPAFATGPVDAAIGDAIYEGLVSYKPGTSDVVPTLAESFEPSSDATRFHFKLKRGIEFHGGYGELTSADVKFAFERIASPSMPNPQQGDWSTLQQVKTEGKYAGTIYLKSPFAPLMRSTLPFTAGRIPSMRAIKKLGKSFATNPIGTGPYQFSSWSPKQQVVLKRFAHYSGANSAYAKPVQSSQLTLVYVLDDNATRTALESGDLDFALIPAAGYSGLAGENFKVYRVPTGGVAPVIWLNVTDPTLSNINVRRAIRQAIDVPSIINAVWNGLFVRAHGIIAPNHLGYWAKAPHYNRDVNKAKQYLQASGMNNVTVKFSIPNLPIHTAIAQIVQSNLASIGITVNIVPTDPATYFNVANNQGGGGPTRQLSLVADGPGLDPYYLIQYYTCAQMNLWNWTQWCNGTFDQLHYLAASQADQKKRAALYIQLQRLWDQQADAIWMAYQTNFFAAKKKVHAVFGPDGYPRWWATRTT